MEQQPAVVVQRPVTTPAVSAPPISHPVHTSESKTAVTPTVMNNTSTGRKYVRGPRGGCYYLNAKGTKSYVDQSLCQ